MKLLTFSTIIVVLTLLTGAAADPRPALQDCGSLLPADSRYSITIDAYWDTSKQPYEEDIAITLVDEKNSEIPYQIPSEAQPFVACIQSALAIG